MLYVEYLIRRKYKSVKEFADVCGVTRCTMHHYLNRFRLPNTFNFMTIADKLDVTAEHLFKNWYKEVEE